MILIKKILIGLCVIVCVLILTLLLLIRSANQGYLDQPIKKLVVFYFSKTDQNILVGNLHVKNYNLSIDEMFIGLDSNTRARLQNVNASFHIKDIISKPLISNNISIEDLSITTIKTDQVIMNAKINVIHKIDLVKNKADTKLDISSINVVGILDSFGKNLPSGRGSCNYNRTMILGSKTSLSCQLHFDGAAYLEFNSTLHGSRLQANGSIKNIPIMFYKFVDKIVPDNEVMLYLHETIKNGYFREGEFNLDCDIEQVMEQNVLPKESLSAKLHIVDLEYKYDPDFPALKKLDADVKISGGYVEFLINKAYSSNSVISGLVTFDWKGMDSSDFIVNAVANGTTSDLVDFIPIEDLSNIKKQGIDLKSITGKAQTTVKLKIPISPDIKNSYEVTSNINNVNGTAFNNNIILQNATVTGVFNGNKINISGKGKVNNFDSNFTYSHNITDRNNDDYKYILKMQTDLIGEKKKIGILKILSGQASLNFEYTRKKDGSNIINMTSNLKDLEFYIDKIAISKKLHKEALLKVTGKLQDISNGNMNLDLTGEDGLKISTNLVVKNNKYNINVPVIRHNNTQLSGKLVLDADNFSADIKGNILDLSQSDMIQFLEKQAEARNTHLKVDIDRVRLKNDIWLDQLNLQIDCNKLKCFSGSLNSKIGTKNFKMLLTDQKDLERWIVSCDNAGALLKAVGMYNNMKSGTLNLTLDTKRHEVRKGEIIPILDGQFSINRFVVTDTSFFTRIASFVSFPGFMSLIVNNKDIMFNQMKGEFSYIRNIVKISDTSATGPFFDFTMKGTIDTNTHKIKLNGNVIPSFFFVGSIITKIPIAGKVFSKVAPYSLELDYK